MTRPRMAAAFIVCGVLLAGIIAELIYGTVTGIWAVTW